MRYLSLLAVLFMTSTSFAGPRDDLWKQVDEAVQKGLPQTAIERLEPIIAGAIKDKSYAEAIKAIGRKIALEGNIQGNKPEEKIVRLQQEIAKAPAEMVPMMEAVLAHWYWHYFQQNRWRFMQRTATDQSPGEDFTTWDLPRIFAEIDKQFAKALAAEDKLKTTPVGDYDDLLDKGNVPDTYRPTLFDFVAHEALRFYSSGEQAAAKPQDSFDLMADSPVFSDVADFCGWQVETTDETSPLVKAIRLYQNLLKFHQKDEDTTALIDADLNRLEFGFNKAFGEEKNDRYKAALKKFTDKWGDHEIAARALHNWASVLHDEGELVEARRLAERGMNAFPETVGGRRCFNLIQQIEAKSSQISTERVWNDPLPKVSITYRNLTKVYFRIVPADYEQRLKSAQYRPEHMDMPGRKQMLAQKPLREWSVDLPTTEDYHQRTEEIQPPQDLTPGFYFLISSHEPGFGENDNIVMFTDFWVSDLALVIRSRQGEASTDGFVLNAITGQPLAGAQVQTWYQEQRGKRAAGPATTTDEHGRFTLKTDQRKSFLIYVKHEGQALASARDYHNYSHSQQERPNEQTIFFTDRSLYRPGQTIRYKGICIHVDQQRDNYTSIANRTLTVIFADPNGKEVARQQHRTNDYGSFDGSFTAPRDRLMGSMVIRVEGEPGGATQFNVEEYKRPKFQVSLDKPAVAAKLNSEVVLSGKATAYTGSPINDAGIRFRVVREVQYPIWWRWFYWWMPPQNNSQEITHGSATTGVDGSFEIRFMARPDLSVAEKDEPVFQYTVYADVTDTTGETRSAQQVVRVGYTALEVAVTADDWQTVDKPVAVSLRTTSLDGEGQLAEGSLKIYRLVPPENVQRASLSQRPQPFPRRGGAMGGMVVDQPPPDLSDTKSWPLGEVVEERGFTTDAGGNASYTFELPAGAYRAVVETQDRFGKAVTGKLPIQVFDPKAEQFAIKIPYAVEAAEWTIEPGDEFQAFWGSGYEKARAFVEIEHRRKVIQAYWTDAERTQVQIAQQVTEAMRGGFTLRVTMVRENRAYMTSRRIEVPWTNKKLSIQWERFVSKLGPAEKQTWTAIISGPDAKRAVAEMVATLYDASLDAYLPHNWPTAFGVFRTDHSWVDVQFENSQKGLQHLHGNWPGRSKDISLVYRSFPQEMIANLWGYAFLGGRGGGFGGMAMPGAPPMQMRRMAAMNADGAVAEMAAAEPMMLADAAAPEGGMDKQAGAMGGAAPPAPPQPDLSQVAARQNLNETAFFFPQLLADEEGRVKLEFTMPEALTEWKFMGFAHDKVLRAGYLQDKAVTAKDLMVEPNPPRFLREGDVLEFTVKVSNQSPTRQTGAVRLTFNDARTGDAVDSQLGNTTTDQPFDIPAGQSQSYSWRLTVPDGMGFLTYKAVGSTGRLSDGEEGYLPVLPRRILVTESLPLPIRGPETKKFEFAKLIESGQSDSLRHQSLTVQMVSNPSWYAVMALPYLMEFPHQCTEQTFNRLYANSLARHIAMSDPKIRRVFDQWKGTPALDSPLEKNQDLKAVMLEETPWLRQAQAESQARRNVGILFDDNRLNDETSRLLQKIAELQREDGAWPWFPGGPANEFITLYITTGFGRLRHLGVDISVEPAVKSLQRLDEWIDKRYREIVRLKRQDENNLTTTIALYLYGRSFFLEDQKIGDGQREAVDYFLGQARKFWLQLANRQSQGHLAIALKRFGDAQTPGDIMRSIKERSVTDEEMGMFWRELEMSWWWFRAPIETQAVMIEAFDEVMNDAQAVEDCKVWLLKQKQTQDWKTTKATADAVYALLLRGTDLLASTELVQITLGGTVIEPQNVEAGTGFYEQRFAAGEIKPQMGRVTVKKIDEGVAWGSLHWQYLEDMSKITPHEANPLIVRKRLYVKEYTDKGPVLKAVEGPVKVGDELVVRVGIRVDRDMEYVHLRDHRGSGTEPVNVLSQYKYQDGLAYYESTRDTASHFFIDYLPKGTYVFEYSTRVVHRGEYQTGMAQVQCMYAPEFNSHSESIPLKVE
jgi:uncharacterized protein YfaS (alpha-2-macroglobulin family)